MNLVEMSVDQLIDRFAQIGIAQRHALDNDDIKGFNKLFRDMRSVNSELRARGHDARLALLRLVDHPDNQVRLQAAKFGYGANPKVARACLQLIADSKRFPQAGDAGMTLAFLDDGTSQLD